MLRKKRCAKNIKKGFPLQEAFLVPICEEIGIAEFED